MTSLPRTSPTFAGNSDSFQKYVWSNWSVTLKTASVKLIVFPTTNKNSTERKGKKTAQRHCHEGRQITMHEPKCHVIKQKSFNTFHAFNALNSDTIQIHDFETFQFWPLRDLDLSPVSWVLSCFSLMRINSEGLISRNCVIFWITLSRQLFWHMILRFDLHMTLNPYLYLGCYHVLTS